MPCNREWSKWFAWHPVWVTWSGKDRGLLNIVFDFRWLCFVERRYADAADIVVLYRDTPL